jgi:hypothetical protein
LVEADSGHYNQSQINAKVARWREAGLTRQVWAQPQHASCAQVPALPGINIMRL